jgi:NAD(P)H-hydrate repair Nnr-like enzyme with NAD(P)H-hydrate dehydratase domain
LLKGSRTVIAEPDGQARINVTGSPALATAGSGDVLTGMVGGLLACGVAMMEAASSAAYLHGLTGMLAGRGAVAGDLAGLIAAAIAQVEADA